MTQSVRTVYVKVAIHLKGHDLNDNNVDDIIDNMDYNFSYEDNHNRIVYTEIVDKILQSE